MCFPAEIAASLATWSTSPLFPFPDLIVSRVSGDIRIYPLATAVRWEGSFFEIFTIRTCPSVSR